MRKYILLLIIPLSANAGCFYDRYGNQTCIEQSPTINYNGERRINVYENGQFMNPPRVQEPIYVPPISMPPPRPVEPYVWTYPR
jgi:hypothetical protein